MNSPAEAPTAAIWVYTSCGTSNTLSVVANPVPTPVIPEEIWKYPISCHTQDISPQSLSLTHTPHTFFPLLKYQILTPSTFHFLPSLTDGISKSGGGLGGETANSADAAERGGNVPCLCG